VPITEIHTTLIGCNNRSQCSESNIVNKPEGGVGRNFFVCEKSLRPTQYRFTADTANTQLLLI